VIFFQSPFKCVLPCCETNGQLNGHLDYNCTKILIKCNEFGKTRNSYIDLLLINSLHATRRVIIPKDDTGFKLG
jgi:hypothetical protein